MIRNIKVFLSLLAFNLNIANAQQSLYSETNRGVTLCNQLRAALLAQGLAGGCTVTSLTQTTSSLGDRYYLFIRRGGGSTTELAAAYSSHWMNGFDLPGFEQEGFIRFFLRPTTANPNGAVATDAEIVAIQNALANFANSTETPVLLVK